MRSIHKLAMTAAFAIVALMGVASSASASVAINIQGAPGALVPITAHSNGLVTFTGRTPIGQTITTNCTFALAGALLSRIPKRAGATIGKIQSTTIQNPCNAGITARILVPPTAFITYASFSGTLPAIGAINFTVNNIGFLLQIGAIGCLYQGNVAASMARASGGGTVGSPAISGPITLNQGGVPLFRDLTASGTACPTTGGLRGTFRLLPTLSAILANS